MKEDKVKSKKTEYDTFSITMELERPLLYNEELKIAEQKVKKLKRKNLKDKILKIILIILVATIIGSFVWISNYYAPDEKAEKALISDNKVQVSMEKDFINFTPKDANPTKGVILYPATKVDGRAYSNLARKIAENGYQVVVVDMPLNLSLLGRNKASKVIEEYKNIDTWVIAGDSSGGIMASKYAAENISKIDGVVLISSYPLDSELKDINMNVLSIWGSKDGVVDFQSLIDAKEKLPNNASYTEIEGANHSQFGDYGLYRNDEKALISSDKQQQKTCEEIVKFIRYIK